jgi:outer membrane protein OmpA-like peptidoglycan-associated protein
MSKAVIIIGGVLGFLGLCFLCATCHGPVMNQAVVPAILTEPSLKATFKSGRVELNGVVPNGDVKNEVVIAARKIVDDGNVLDKLTVSSTVGTPSWLPSALGLFGLMHNGVKQAVFSIQNGSLTVSGVVPTAEAKAKLISDIAGNNLNLRVIDDIVIEEKAEVVQQRVGDYLNGKTIEFETASAVLLPRGKAILDTVATLLRNAPDARIEVGGHTDNQGDDASNMELSVRRSQSTRDYLVAKGIDGERLDPIGFGESKPVAPNTTIEGRQRNRRIEFHLK